MTITEAEASGFAIERLHQDLRTYFLYSKMRGLSEPAHARPAASHPDTARALRRAAAAAAAARA